MSFDDDFSFSDLQVTDTPRKPPRGRPPREESPLRVQGRVPRREHVAERGLGPGPGAGAKSTEPSKPPPPRAPGGPLLL